MLISFIIVAYNAEKVIKNCLNSLNEQNYPHREIEVLLIDSNSTDNKCSSVIIGLALLI